MYKSTDPKTIKKCPCCSGKLFLVCCYPYLSGEALPKTAVQLMRSRYSAYALGNISYIQQTMRGEAAKDFDPQGAQQWADQALWCGLKIIDAGKQDPTAENDEVEFAARYVLGNDLYILQERSQFQKIETQWFYVSGQRVPHQATPIRNSDPCPCGSKRKFMQCCRRKQF